MFGSVQANPVKTVDAIKNYDDLTAFILNRGNEMMMKAIQNNDLVYMEAMRADVIMVRDGAIELINARYDYLTWYSFAMYTNGKSKLIALDMSGDLKAAVVKFGQLDGQSYYEQYVKPLYESITEVELRMQYAQVLGIVDNCIEQMRVNLGR